MSGSSGQGVHSVARYDSGGNLSAADDQNISSLLAASAWNGPNISFSFPTSSTNYGPFTAYGDPAPYAGFRALTAQQQGEVQRAFNLIGSYTNETFTNIAETDTTHATIRLANSGAPPTSYAYYPSTDVRGGDVFYGGTGQHPVMGNFDSGQATLHEIGHALGLKHGQDNNTYGVMNADRLDIEFSLMNYPNYIGSSEGFATASTSAQTYMMYDIAALQYMYGANFSQLGQNNVYTWSETTGTEFVNGVSQGTPVDNHIFETIWTEGANSTYDLNNFSQNQVDDMNPGGWMDFSTSQLADLNAYAFSKPTGEIFARGDIYNALEYNGDPGSLIDNIITGPGDDIIVGNAANNIVDGGGGTNTFVERGNHTDYQFQQLNTGYIQITDSINGRDGTDQVKNIQYLKFADGTFLISDLISQTWFGGTGNFSDPQNWSPAGSPAATDTLVIDAGRVRADNLAITNPNIRLGSPTATPTLILQDSTLAATSSVRVETTTFDPSQPDLDARIRVVGAVTEDGAIDVGTTGTDVNQLFPAHLTISMAKGSTYTMDPGAIWFSSDGSTLDVNAPEHAAQFVNNGEVEAFGGTVRMNVPVTGQGTFDVLFNNNNVRAGTLEFAESVGAGETVKLDAGLLKLDEPGEFLASIQDFNPDSTIELTHTKVTSADYSNGILTLFDKHRAEARLDIVGNFTTEQFAITNHDGNAFVTLNPSAPVSPEQCVNGMDGSTLDRQVAQLISAMATHSAGNSGISPMTTQTQSDSSLQNTLAPAWHS
jgi:hypothetical protein